MGNSLRDQLLKAGLVSGQKARQTENDVKRKTHQSAKNKKKKQKSGAAKPAGADSQVSRAEKAYAEKLARDRALNLERDAERAKKAQRAEVRELITRNQVNDPDGEFAYNFVGGKHIKHVYVNEEQKGLLSRGHLAVARWEGKHYLIPRDTAEKIQARIPKAVVHLNENKKQEADKDDPYADYQVPDDLMW
ncbi:MAG: DUF2058 domain-containing protein [Gammaproteobacteria bacterium]|nr:DUF2058 domain-containing protein [Gammaproteobacteria bacterium]